MSSNKPVMVTMPVVQYLEIVDCLKELESVLHKRIEFIEGLLDRYGDNVPRGGDSNDQ